MKKPYVATRLILGTRRARYGREPVLVGVLDLRSTVEEVYSSFLVSVFSRRSYRNAFSEGRRFLNRITHLLRGVEQRLLVAQGEAVYFSANEGTASSD